MSFAIEEESGTYSGTFSESVRRHDGYYAGDFGGTRMLDHEQLAAITRMQSPRR